MANITINSLPTASTIDATNDLLPIYTNSLTATQAISRNTYLNLSSQPVGLTDSQTLTNKTLTSPTINWVGTGGLSYNNGNSTYTASASTGITVATTNANAGVSGTNANLPPYLGINFIIKT